MLYIKLLRPLGDGGNRGGGVSRISSGECLPGHLACGVVWGQVYGLVINIIFLYLTLLNKAKNNNPNMINSIVRRRRRSIFYELRSNKPYKKDSFHTCI